MFGEIWIGGDKGSLINSCDIAKKYGKRNPDVNRTINNLKKRILNYPNILLKVHMFQAVVDAKSNIK